MDQTPQLASPNIPDSGNCLHPNVQVWIDSSSFVVNWLLEWDSFILDELLSKYPFLSNYIENLRYYFWKTWFSKRDILWEWNYWLVIKLPHWRIMKLAKNKEISDWLEIEARNQEKFYLAVSSLRNELWEDVIPYWFKIPFIMESPTSNSNWFYSFEMEYVEWSTLRNYDAKKFYSDFLKWIEDSYLDSINDIGLDSILISRWISQEEIDFSSSYSWIIILEQYFPFKASKIKRIIDLMASIWYEHLDLHSKNLMISWESIYMIDFWIVKLPN